MKKTGIMLILVLLIVLGSDLALPGAAKEAEPVQETQEENGFEEIGQLLSEGKTDEALKRLEKEDRGSMEYYYLKEIAYIQDGSERANEQLAQMYLEAADDWPEWQHMQKMAGVAAIYEGNYKSAEYRLLQALRLDPEDAETWYYLGTVCYYEKNYDDMRMYFEHALERDLSETKQQEILWYAAQTGDRE